MTKKRLFLLSALMIGLSFVVCAYGANGFKEVALKKINVIDSVIRDTLLTEYNIEGSIPGNNRLLPGKVLFSFKEMSGNDYLTQVQNRQAHMREQGFEYSGISVNLENLNIISQKGPVIVCTVMEHVQLTSTHQTGEEVITREKKKHRFTLKVDKKGKFTVLVHEFLDMYNIAPPKYLQSPLSGSDFYPYVLDKSKFPKLSPLQMGDDILVQEEHTEESIYRAMGTYNGTAAKDYARQYALNYNTAYRSWAADCTNFASQSLRAGGWEDDLGWYQSNYNWWYTSSLQTWSWNKADDLFWFTYYSGRGYTVSYFSSLSLGDLVQADWDDDGDIDHAMIVTKKIGSSVYVSYHSNDTLDKYVGDLPSDATYYGWHITSTN